MAREAVMLREIPTKYGMVEVDANEVGSYRILELIQDFAAPDGVIEAGANMHRTHRHDEKDAVSPPARYDFVPRGIWDLRSRFERIKQFERETEGHVIHVSRRAVRNAKFLVTRYKTLTEPERRHLVHLDTVAARGLEHAVNKHKVKVCRMLRHADSVYDRKGRLNPGKTNTELTGGENELLIRAEEVAAIFKYISHDIILCDGEIDRIVNLEYQPIGDMAASWILQSRVPGKGLVSSDVSEIVKGFSYAIERLRTIQCHPYRTSAQELISLLRETLQNTDAERIVTVLHAVSARVHGEKRRTDLLQHNVELGCIQAARLLDSTTYGLRVYEVADKIAHATHKSISHMGRISKIDAKRKRTEIAEALQESSVLENRGQLKRVRELIKDFALLIN